MQRAKEDGFIEKLRKARRSGYTSDAIDKKQFTNIIRLLDSAVSRAVKRNEPFLSNYEQILERKSEKRLNTIQAQEGLLPNNLLLPTR